MVEDVEGVGLEFQDHPFRDLEVLKNREIETRLEWGAEDVSAVRPITGFYTVANRGPCSSRAAGWNSALAGTKEWDGEIIRIDVRNPDTGQRAGGERIVGSTLSSLLG